MSIFQVQYKHQSHTYVSDIEADSVDNVYNLFDEMIVAEILEIRKYVYEDKRYIKDDGNYVNGLSFLLVNDNQQNRKITLKKIKKNLNPTELVSTIKSYLRFIKSNDFKVVNIKYY